MKKSLGAKTLALPTPTWLVGNYDGEGQPNAATVAWGGICNSQPPSVAISLRAATYSHGNIMRRKAFTVSIPSQDHVRETDYFGLASGAKENKFATTQLTPVPSELVDAPYVEQCPLVLECNVLHVHELGLHTQFIGEIVDVKADESVLTKNGHLDPSLVRPVIFAPGTRTYHAMGEKLGKAFFIGKSGQ
jgi:flavin reductase (DIM6/NTAB) family NADH-FMN oxidoreductase RutF